MGLFKYLRKSFSQRNDAKRKIPYMFEKGNLRVREQLERKLKEAKNKTLILEAKVKSMGGGDTKLQDSIYESKPVKWSSHLSKFHFLQYVFKYRLLVPSLHVVIWLMKGRLVKHIDGERHNQFIKAVDTAWERAIKDWNAFYEVKKKKNNLRYLKQIVLTYLWYDTAYRNWIACFCAQLTKMVQETHRVDLDVFDKSWEKATYDWNVYCLRPHHDVKTDDGHEEWAKRYREEKWSMSNTLMRNIKALIITSAQESGEVQKFLQLFLSALASEVMEKCVVDDKIPHVFYTTNMGQMSLEGQQISLTPIYYKCYVQVNEMHEKQANGTTKKTNVLNPVVEQVNKVIIPKGVPFPRVEDMKPQGAKP